MDLIFFFSWRIWPTIYFNGFLKTILVCVCVRILPFYKVSLNVCVRLDPDLVGSLYLGQWAGSDDHSLKGMSVLCMEGRESAAGGRGS